MKWLLSKPLSSDIRLLFVTRLVRMFAYGFLSVVLVLYLVQMGLSVKRIGLLLTLTLLGDTAVSLWLTTSADHFGRRKTLIIGAILMVVAGIIFSLTHNFAVLLGAAIVGVISPSGNEVGPFLSVEQASLAQIIPADQRTGVIAWYNLVGSFTTAVGALAGGGLAELFRVLGWTPLASYRLIVIAYAAIGLLLALLFSRLSAAIEAPVLVKRTRISTFLGLHQSRGVVFRLSFLFGIDAFAGGFVMQSLIAYWFHLRFGMNSALLGSVFFGANILAGISALSATWIASHIGLVRTMVFTHMPSNVLLILVPLMPSPALAIAVLLLRFSISQMDVPTRQSYTMAVVQPDERSAAAGVTGMARTIGAALSPVLISPMLANPAYMSVPFFLAGGLKLIYDVLLYRSFKSIKPDGE